MINSGDTLHALLTEIDSMEPRSVTVCTVLRKDRPCNAKVEGSCRNLTVLPAFIMDGDVWVAGYGLDGGSDSEYRHLHTVIVAGS